MTTMNRNGGCDAPMTCSCVCCQKAYALKALGPIPDAAVRASRDFEILRGERDRAESTRASYAAALDEVHEAIKAFAPEAVHTASWLAQQLRDLAEVRGQRDVARTRVAELEAKLMGPSVLRIETDGELVELGSVHDAGRIELLVTRVDGERLPMLDLLASREMGPGIASVRPDNSVAHLDEDLLCEDAD